MPDIGVLESDVLRTISPRDEMLGGDEPHYFRVGQSAMECIEVSLRSAGKDPFDVKRILDLPCGHGRVLRYLRAGFPDAQITACDVLRDGVDFCASEFGAIPVYSQDDPTRIPLDPEQFDLIWVGSLFTHFEAGLWQSFLQAFQSWLAPGGVLIFTTHGRQAYDWAAKGAKTYELDHRGTLSLLYNYETRGFGYAKYPGSENYYGVSFSDPAWVLRELLKLEQLRIVHFAEKALDRHQDCFACIREPQWIQQFPKTSKAAYGKLKEYLKQIVPSR